MGKNIRTQKKWRLHLKPLLAILFFSLPVMVLFASGDITDSILTSARGKPAKERIEYYSRRIFDFADNNSDLTAILTDSVFHLLKTHTDTKVEIYALRSVGFYYLHNNNYDSAFCYMRQAALLNNKIKDTIQQAKILIDLGNIYIAEGAAVSALVCYQAADSIAGLSDPSLKCAALLNMGSIYQNYKFDHQKALKYLESANELRDHTNTRNKIILFQKLSIEYRHTGNDSLALHMAQQSFNLAMNEGFLGDAAAAINSAAQIHLKQGRYDQAIAAFGKARDIAVEMNMTKGIIFTNGNIADTWFLMGKYREGLDLYQKLLKIAVDNKFDYIRSEIYKKMIPFYKKLGYFEQALATSEKLNLLHDSLALSEKEQKIAKLEARYHSRINEATISQQKVQINKDRTTIWMLIVIVLIVALSLIMISRLFIVKNRSLKKLVDAHKDLTTKNKRIMELIPSHPVALSADNSNHVFEKIYHYLITNQNYLTENITLEKVASDTSINREYIRSAIKHAEGCSFKTFINNHRIDYAKNLIMENIFGRFSIDEIARKSGFSSRTSFYRTFHEVTGFTPAYYKSQLEKHAAGRY